MSAQTLVYLYNQRQLVVLLEPSVPVGTSRRFEKVYSKKLTINKGVDNVLEFQFVNQNQKPVNITMPAGKEITCRILNQSGTEVLIQKSLTPVYPITGIAKLDLTAGEVENIETQYCYYSLEIPQGAFDYPVFVDDNAGARGTIAIVNSVLPPFLPAVNITIPSHNPPVPNANVNTITYYSSVVNTTESPILTMQTHYEQFTGNITIQGSTVQDFSVYYDIGEPYSYSNSGQIPNVVISGTDGFFTCDEFTNLTVGQSVTINGTQNGTGTIAGNPSGGTIANSVYFIVATNNATNFVLAPSAANAAPIDTTAGTTTGLTFTINGFTGTTGYNIEGYHPFIRTKIVNIGTNPYGNTGALSGDVTQILARTGTPYNRRP